MIISFCFREDNFWGSQGFWEYIVLETSFPISHTVYYQRSTTTACYVKRRPEIWNQLGYTINFSFQNRSWQDTSFSRKLKVPLNNKSSLTKKCEIDQCKKVWEKSGKCLVFVNFLKNSLKTSKIRVKTAVTFVLKPRL